MKSFEAIAENLVNQENFTRIQVVGDDVTLVGKRVGGFSLSHTYILYDSSTAKMEFQESHLVCHVLLTSAD